RFHASVLRPADDRGRSRSEAGEPGPLHPVQKWNAQLQSVAFGCEVDGVGNRIVRRQHWLDLRYVDV
ncbi:uncharacterized protein METZ01_LOCUS305409, partial [marine metagenome]